MTAWKLLFGAYFGLLGLIVLALLFWLYGDLDLDLLAQLLGVPLLGPLALGLVLHAIFRRSRGEALRAGFSILLGVAVVLGAQSLRSVGTRLFFWDQRDELDAFVSDILASGRIHEMSDGMRHFKELNGDLVAYTAAEVDTQRQYGIRSRVPLAQVLERDSIPVSQYQEYRTRLQRVHLIDFEVTDDYVAFTRDGFLDNLYGFVYVRPGRPVPEIDSGFVEGLTLVLLEPMGDGWYFFATT